jgi:hypothetical protein
MSSQSLHLNINLSFKQLVAVVKQLSPTEKLKLNEIIWNENTAIPAEHKKLVLNRIKKAKQKPNSMLDWEAASKTLKP